jgi:hypothetical protein
MARTIGVLVVTVWLSTLTSCTAPTQQSIEPPSPPAIISPSVPDLHLESISELCAWYAKSQGLRAERVVGSTGLVGWFVKYGTANSPQPDTAALEDLANLIRQYLPVDQQFVSKWSELTPPSGGQVFWAGELAAEQLRIQAFQVMLTGLDQHEPDEYERGWRLFTEAARASNNAEEEMSRIHSKCLSSH